MCRARCLGRLRSFARRCSVASSRSFRSAPHRYPPTPPALGTTRWQGTTRQTGIGRAGAGHRADRFRLADAPGDLGVGPRLAVRNPLQRAPHLPLESGGAHVDRQIERRRIAAQVLGDRLDPFALRLQVRLRSRRPDTRAADRAARVDSLLPIFTEHTPVSVAATSTCANRARDHRVADPHAGAAAAVIRQRHALAGRRRLVDAARRSISGFVNRRRHVAAIAQAGPQASRRAPPTEIPSATTRRSP